MTGFLGELFGAVQAVKVANAEGKVIAHFAALNDDAAQSESARGRIGAVIEAFEGGSIDFGIGVILLLAGQAMAAGTFTVGDFALFTYYLGLRHRPARAHRQLHRRLPGRRRCPSTAWWRWCPTNRRRSCWNTTRSTRTAANRCPRRPGHTAADPLVRLEVRGLTYRHPGSTHGIRDVDLRMRRRLVHGDHRAHRLGQDDAAAGAARPAARARAGEIRWNGQPVADPAGFFVPAALRLHAAGAAPVQRDAAREHPARLAGR